MVRCAHRSFSEAAVAQSAVVFQHDEGVLEKQGPDENRDRASRRSGEGK